MSEWSMRPKVCSECPAPIPYWRGRGAPRDTCSPACAVVRNNRRKREIRAQAKARREADAANAKYLTDNSDFFSSKGTPPWGEK